MVNRSRKDSVPREKPEIKDLLAVDSISIKSLYCITMRITEEQMALIRSLHCERLASNEENLRLIDSFYSTRNNNVAEALLNEVSRR